MEKKNFHIAYTTIFLRTTSFCTQGVPMNNLANMKNCPEVQGNLNWMLDYWVGVKGQNIFTESSHVAYKIKGYGI